jgi:hypothetical protein
VILPRRGPLLETFADHLAADAKKLVEDEETGAKSYRYIRTGTNHFSLAFTYDWIASEQERRPACDWRLLNDDDSGRTMVSRLRERLGPDAPEWPPRWDRQY